MPAARRSSSARPIAICTASGATRTTPGTSRTRPGRTRRMRIPATRSIGNPKSCSNSMPAEAARRVLSFGCATRRHHRRRTIASGARVPRNGRKRSGGNCRIVVSKWKPTAPAFPRRHSPTAWISFNVSPKLANAGIPASLRLNDDALRFFAGRPNAWFKFVVCRPEDLFEIQELRVRFGIGREPHPVDARGAHCGGTGPARAMACRCLPRSRIPFLRPPPHPALGRPARRLIHKSWKFWLAKAAGTKSCSAHVDEARLEGGLVFHAPRPAPFAARFLARLAGFPRHLGGSHRAFRFHPVRSAPPRFPPRIPRRHQIPVGSWKIRIPQSHRHPRHCRNGVCGTRPPDAPGGHELLPCERHGRRLRADRQANRRPSPTDRGHQASHRDHPL